MLTKTHIAQVIEAMTGVKPNLVKNVLDALAELALDEISQGEDFTVPGIAKLSYSYRAPQKKGDRWSKGQEVVGFGGIASVKDADSPPVKALIKLRASLTGAVSRNKPGTKPEAQAAFMKTKAAKRVIARKSR
jgi:nucleoid DNA-binding protein